MICRFFCAMHKCHHFLAELTDDLDNAACLEIGERATCHEFMFLAVNGIYVRNPEYKPAS